jgi:hypothetical protein
VPSADPLPVDVSAVHAQVHQDVALAGGLNLRVPARHLVAADDDVGTRVSSEDQRFGAYGVLPAIGEADQAPTGAAGRRFGRLDRWGKIGERAGVEELGVTAAAGVYRKDFVTGDLDLIPVEDRRGIGSKRHAVDEELGARLRRADRRRSLGTAVDDGVPGSHPLALEDDGTTRGRPYDRLTGGDGDPFATDFEVHHSIGS